MPALFKRYSDRECGHMLKHCLQQSRALKNGRLLHPLAHIACKVEPSVYCKHK